MPWEVMLWWTDIAQTCGVSISTIKRWRIEVDYQEPRPRLEGDELDDVVEHLMAGQYDEPNGSGSRTDTFPPHSTLHPHNNTHVAHKLTSPRSHAYIMRKSTLARCEYTHDLYIMRLEWPSQMLRRILNSVVFTKCYRDGEDRLRRCGCCEKEIWDMDLDC